MAACSFPQALPVEPMLANGKTKNNSNRICDQSIFRSNSIPIISCAVLMVVPHWYTSLIPSVLLMINSLPQDRLNLFSEHHLSLLLLHPHTHHIPTLALSMLWNFHFFNHSYPFKIISYCVLVSCKSRWPNHLAYPTSPHLTSMTYTLYRSWPDSTSLCSIWSI
jgi:hypothetical protein